MIGTAGVPSRYGGFETLAHQLVERIGDEKNMVVYCSSSIYPRQEGRGPFKGARRVFLPLKANGWQSIFYDLVSIIHAAIFFDVLMVFGVSGAIALPFVRAFTNRKVVVHIDGLEWKRAKWSGWAQRFLRWSEKIAIRFSDAHVADNPAIQRYTMERYGKAGWMIPYGGDHAFHVRPNLEDRLEYPFMRHAYVFSVCRIEPENNIEMILKAFSKQPNRQLVIVGNWDASTYGKDLLKQFRIHHNIKMLHPIYAPERLNLLRSNCLAYVHGHSAGGTNPSLVEAMHLGLPVLAFDVEFNRETTEGKAIFFSDAEELEGLLKDLSLNELHHCALEMGRIADQKYTWDRVVDMYSNRLDWLEKSNAALDVTSAYAHIN